MHLNFKVDEPRFSFIADFLDLSCYATSDRWAVEITSTETMNQIVAQIIGLIEGCHKFLIIQAGKQNIAITIEPKTA